MLLEQSLTDIGAIQRGKRNVFSTPLGSAPGRTSDFHNFTPKKYLHSP